MTKRVPNYWWDFVWEDHVRCSIKIETDDPRCPGYLEEFTVVNPSEADKIVKDLKSGRLKYKRK